MAKNAYVKAACLGIMTGIRNLSAPTLLNEHFARSNPPAFANSKLAFLGSKQASGLLSFLAKTEIAGDKMPNIPKRTSPGPLASRAIVGALAGAAISQAEGERPEIGALIGAATAIGASFAFTLLRAKGIKKFNLPNPLLGSMEDALIVGLGRLVVEAP